MKNSLLLKFLEENPQVEMVEMVLSDLNGIYRGKWVPVSGARKVLEGKFKIPLTAVSPDIWGRDLAQLRGIHP